MSKNEESISLELLSKSNLGQKDMVKSTYNVMEHVLQAPNMKKIASKRLNQKSSSTFYLL